MPDVYLVTNWQAIQWIRDPTPLSRMHNFEPFKCDYSVRLDLSPQIILLTLFAYEFHKLHLMIMISCFMTG